MSKELIVCHKCLHENEAIRDFCQNCGATIGMFTTISPFKKIHAEGNAYCEASSNPTKLIVVIGIWMLFLPGAALFLYAIYTIITEQAWDKDLVWFLLYGAISIAMLSKTTINFIKYKNMQNQRLHSIAAESSSE